MARPSAAVKARRAAESSPFCLALRQYLMTCAFPLGGAFKLPATAWLQALNLAAPEWARMAPEWPTNAARLGMLLSRYQEGLYGLGIHTTYSRADSAERLWQLKLVEDVAEREINRLLSLNALGKLNAADRHILHSHLSTLVPGSNPPPVNERFTLADVRPGAADYTSGVWPSTPA